MWGVVGEKIKICGGGWSTISSIPPPLRISNIALIRASNLEPAMALLGYPLFFVIFLLVFVLVLVFQLDHFLITHHKSISKICVIPMVDRNSWLNHCATASSTRLIVVIFVPASFLKFFGCPLFHHESTY